MVMNDVVETHELNKKAEEVQKPEDAARVIRQYEDIIRVILLLRKCTVKMQRSFHNYLLSS